MVMNSQKTDQAACQEECREQKSVVTDAQPLAPIFRLPNTHTNDQSQLESASALASLTNHSSDVLDVYPNLYRRKRKRSDELSSRSAQLEAARSAAPISEQQNSSWLGQLEDAAGLDKAGFQEYHRQSVVLNDSPVEQTIMISDIPDRQDQQRNLHRSTPAPVVIDLARQSENSLLASVPETTEKQGTPKKKMLKLSASGKLFSPPKPPKSPKFKGKARGRLSDGSNKIEPKTKVVVLKYQSSNDNDMHQRIADILASSKNKQAKAKATQSAKSTHPFFLGKPKTKAEKSASSDSSLASSLPAKRQHGENSTIRTSTSRPSSRAGPGSPGKPPTFSRNPDVLLPIWPPSGFDIHRKPRHAAPNGDTVSRFQSHQPQKKKQAVVNIPISQNILENLSTRLRNAVASDSSTRIRLPQRKLISGDESLRILDSSEIPPGNRGSLSPKDHPAIKHVRSVTHQTSHPFDLGKYESMAWTTKYSPTKAEEVLQHGREPGFLRDWIQSLVVSAVDNRTQPKMHRDDAKSGRKKKRRKKEKKDLDDFIVSTDDEANELVESDGELHHAGILHARRSAFRASGPSSRQGSIEIPKNAILLSGPHGCGKTASVYAIAKELGFEIFEVNPGARRAGKDILDRVGDMTQNHLVQGHDAGDDLTDASLENLDQTSVEEEVATGKQATMNSFFKSKPSKKPAETKTGSKKQLISEPIKPRKSQKQSLILVEEVDILYEEDKAFWNVITSLITTSKRPIIMTCSDENLVPFQELSLEAILRYQRPPEDLVTEYLMTMTACEGHMIHRNDILRLYRLKDYDLRASIMDLNFWCQMAIGSTKGSLDWIIDKGKEVSINDRGESLRITSIGSYEADMSLQPLLSGSGQSEESVERLMALAEAEFDIPTTEWTPSLESLVDANLNSSAIEALNSISRATEYISSLDLIYSHDLDSFGKPVIDPAHPELSSKSRISYCEGYPLLETFERTDYTQTSRIIAGSMIRLVQTASGGPSLSRTSTDSIMSIKFREPTRHNMILSNTETLHILAPLEIPPPIFPPPSGRLTLSIESTTPSLITDTTPYVRHIAAYDLRLKYQREELEKALSSQESGPGVVKRKGRTTRAARAALEGGRKEETRRESWFHDSLDLRSVLGTGCPEWRDAVIKEIHDGGEEDDNRDDDGDDGSEKSGETMEVD